MVFYPANDQIIAFILHYELIAVLPGQNFRLNLRIQ